MIVLKVKEHFHCRVNFVCSVNIGQRCLWVSGTSEECDLCCSLCLSVATGQLGCSAGLCSTMFSMTETPETQEGAGAAHILALDIGAS